ncbi:MAG: HIT domain-containing protein [Bacteroidetes bacterium]|nr:MAG: HIT domain-containing protein [Bacteroidota bacterium]
MEQFILHPRLARDSMYVASLRLCQVRLINNQDFIWFILVPRIDDLTHFIDLSSDHQKILFKEINQVAQILTQAFSPERLNIASLGNVVEQMHWHIIVRYQDDKAWPDPVWGRSFVPYDAAYQSDIISRFLTVFQNYEAS